MDSLLVSRLHCEDMHDGSLLILTSVTMNLPLFNNRSMRIPKIKKDPKTINIRKLKSFNSVAFLEELK